MPSPVYATDADYARFGTAPSAIASIPQTTREGELAAASREADSYFGSRYRFPIVSWDDAVTKHVVSIALYGLFCTRGYNPGAGGDVNIRLRYEDAIAWLTKVAKQQVHPAIVDTQNPGPVAYGPKVFGRPRRIPRGC